MDPEDDNEEVVLKRWDKIKQWWEMGSTLVKVIRYGILAAKLLFVGSATAVVVGEVTDTTPIRNVAEEVGVLGKKAPLTIDDLWVKVMELEEDVEVLQLPHQHNYPDPVVGRVGPSGPPGPPGKDAQVSDDYAKLEATIKELEDKIPDRHLKLH